MCCAKRNKEESKVKYRKGNRKIYVIDRSSSDKDSKNAITSLGQYNV